MLELVNNANCGRAGSTWYAAVDRNALMSNDYNSIAAPSDVVYYDPMMDLMSGLEFRSPLVSFLELAGYADPDKTPRTSNVLGFKPSPEDLPSKLGRLHTLSEVLRFLSGSTSQVDGLEHNCAHFNLVGKVSEGAVDMTFPRSVLDLLTRVTINGDRTGYSFDVWQGGVTPPTYGVKDLPVIATAVGAGAFNLNVNPNVTIEVSNFRWGLDDGGLLWVRYKLTHGAYGGLGDGIHNFLWYKEIEVAWAVTWTWLNTPTVDQYTFFERLHATHWKAAHCVKHFVRNYGESINWYLSPAQYGSEPTLWPEAVSFSNRASWNATTAPTFGWEAYSGISGADGYRKVDNGITSYLRFRQETHRIQNDMLVMGFLAQGKAWDDNIVTLKTNIVEFLFELSDIADLIANPIEVIEKFATGSLAVFIGGRRTMPGLRSLLEACTDAQLFYSFMLRPSWKLATEVALKAKALLQSFDLFFGWQEIRGQASYQMADEFPFFTGSLLVGNAKMRVRIPPDSLLAAFLPYEKLGLLPSLSRYWETLRLSFVVDWFFNVKSKLDIIDKTVRFLALDVAYVTNSVSLYKPIIPTNFMVEDETSYKYYARWVLPSAQVFTPTHLNVLGASGVPSWLTAGSLFYKLIP